jgi:predicted extracellular nuclease
VLAVQEVMDLDTLEALADRIAEDDPAVIYHPYLMEGNDFGGIDVGFLVRDPARVLDVSQIGADARLTWDGSLLFDRPPLVLEAEFSGSSGEFEATFVAVHLRSLGGIDDPDDGERVRQKRDEQSRWLADWIQDRQNTDPAEPLIVLGDFNAFEFSDGYVDVMGQVTGEPDPDGALLPAGEDVDPPLVNWLLRLPASDRYSFVFECSAEALDHVVTNRAATGWVRGVAFSRGNADAPNDLELDAATALRSSDHDGLVIYLGPRVRRGTGRPVAPVSRRKAVSN